MHIFSFVLNNLLISIIVSINFIVLVCLFIWNIKLSKNVKKLKHSEKALQESEERLRLAGKTSFDLIFEWNIKKVSLEWFGNLEGFIGYKDGEISGNLNDWISLIHPDDLELAATAITLHQNSIAPIHYEYKAKHKNGEYRNFSINGLPVLDKSGEPYKWIGVCTDITDKKQAEEKIIKGAKEWQMTFDSIKSAVWILDRNQKIIRSNKTASILFETPQEEILGKFCWEIITDEKISKDNCDAVQAKKTLKRVNSEKLINGKWFEIIIDPIVNNAGEFDGAIQIISDISDRKKAETNQKKLEEHLQVAQKMEAIGTLAGGIAHDFNNMLGIIMGNISYLLTITKDNPEFHEILMDVQNGAEQAQNLTQQLLTFSKGGEPIKKITNLNNLIKETATLVTRGSKSKCVFDLSEDLWHAKVDSGQINQAIGNIMINAVQSIPEGGIIKLETQNITVDSIDKQPLSNGNYINLKISDNGSGIHEKYLSKIFEPFFTTKNTGNGIGLATTFSIIKRHNGHVEVESFPGKGTCFNIFLPAEINEKEIIKNKVVNHHNGSGKVLIMDDQKEILKMATKMLNISGYDVATATDGRQAIEIYKKSLNEDEPFDFVILDLTVPGGIGGMETIPELIALNPDVKAIVSSGYATDPVMANYKDFGFFDIMPKPYTRSEISRVLDKVHTMKLPH